MNQRRAHPLEYLVLAGTYTIFRIGEYTLLSQIDLIMASVRVVIVYEASTAVMLSYIGYKASTPVLFSSGEHIRHASTFEASTPAMFTYVVMVSTGAGMLSSGGYMSPYSVLRQVHAIYFILGRLHAVLGCKASTRDILSYKASAGGI